ncbi:BTE_collapsed_G0033180.mRNA.1.CDS.1 [Saccharomyces cerevisiae]|nr:BTE_collapsed_G0033180.mRNA.1.CDS.1 [Saccharomyces cerevisiae]
MVSFRKSGPIWPRSGGKDVVKQGRTILGATNPLSVHQVPLEVISVLTLGRNVCHGSDSVDSAEREINLWFKKEELVDWESNQAKWIYE